ncbi:unnamed protein product [Lathyrus oleraceus]
MQHLKSMNHLWKT